MQSLLAQGQHGNANSTDSPTYQCRSGGIPTLDVTGHYCVVKGGAKRMDICCGTSPVNFYPDCYSWCNVDLPPYNGLDPSYQVIRKFSQCLEIDQDPAYFPEMMCLNGTVEQRSSSSSSQSALSTSTSLTSGVSTQPAATTTSNSDSPTGTQPVASPTTMPGSASREFGAGIWIAAALVLIQIVAAGTIL